MQKKTVGIGFSGGAARGIAHLGVLEALNELQIPVGVGPFFEISVIVVIKTMKKR